MNSTGTETDIRFMKLALRLASRGLGTVAPNPSVGCILVKDGRVIARGWTRAGGRPHAETEALRCAGDAAKGATAYVTLEPCAHHGKTPPCANALIDAGISRVVMAIDDPDPRTAGQGRQKLLDAGLDVRTNILAQEAADLNRGFFLRIQSARPMVTLKLAMSLDGRIASACGHSQWITGALARQHGHLLRKSHDAIMVGARTFDADRPSLTCRLPGLEHHSPQPILLTSRPEDYIDKLTQYGTRNPPWLIACPKEKTGGYKNVIPTKADTKGCISIPSLLTALAQSGITRLLLEGGANTAASFLRANLIDRIYLYRAPIFIGADGLAGLGSLDVQDVVKDTKRFLQIDSRPLGEDTLEVYETRERA